MFEPLIRPQPCWVATWLMVAVALSSEGRTALAQPIVPFDFTKAQDVQAWQPIHDVAGRATLPIGLPRTQTGSVALRPSFLPVAGTPYPMRRNFPAYALSAGCPGRDSGPPVSTGCAPCSPTRSRDARAVDDASFRKPLTASA